MIPDFKDCTLGQRQQYYYNAAYCIYCRQETEFIDSIKVYQESYGMIHYCGHCDAWCGTLPMSDQSLGTVAKKRLRNLRIEAHKVYDPLIDAKVNQLGTKRKQAQAQGREWLANYLNLDIEECHIAYLSEENCIRLIEKCKSLYPTEEQILKRQSDIKYRIGTVYFLAGDMDFGVKEFNINGQIQMEIKHRDGRVYYFDPKKKTGRWSNKKNPSPVEDIEDFILKHFSIKQNEKDMVPTTITGSSS